MATSPSTSSNGRQLIGIGLIDGPNDVQDNLNITHLMERTQIDKDSGCIDDSELSVIGSGIGPNELQKIAVRHLKVPQPAIDTYKASARYRRVIRKASADKYGISVFAS